MGQRKAPKDVGMCSRKWHVTALEFGVMGRKSESEVSFSAVRICSGLNSVLLESMPTWSLKI